MTDTEEIIKAAREIVNAQKKLFPEERTETDMVSLYNTAQVVHLVGQIRAMAQLLPPEILPCPAGHEAELIKHGRKNYSIGCKKLKCMWGMCGDDLEQLIESWSKRE